MQTVVILAIQTNIFS